MRIPIIRAEYRDPPLPVDIDPGDDDAGGNAPPIGPAANDSSVMPDGAASTDIPAPAPPTLEQTDARAQTASAIGALLGGIGPQIDAAKQSAGPGGAGFTGLTLDGFDQLYQQQHNALPSGARPDFTAIAKPLRDFIGQGALHFEAGQRLAWYDGIYTSSLGQWAGAVAKSPALAPLANAALDGTLPALGQRSEALKELTRGTIMQAGVTGALAQDPAGLFTALGGSLDMGQVGASAGDAGSDDPDAHPVPAAVDLTHPLVAMMTPEEREHYREVARVILLQQQATLREHTGTRIADATASYLATGTAKEAPTLGQLTGIYGNDEGARRYNIMMDAALTGQTRQRILPLPQSELQKLQAQVPPEDDLVGQRNYRALTQAVQTVQAERTRDPVGFALKSGSYGLAPIQDFNSPDLAAELGRRQRAQGTLQQDYGVAPAVLSKDETAQLAKTLKGMTPDQQQTLLGNLAQGFNDPQAMQTAMRGLSATSQAAALAGLYVAQDNARADQQGAGGATWGGDGRISAPQLLLQGDALLNPQDPNAKPQAMPADQQLRSAYIEQMNGRLVDQPGALESYYQGARAVYATLAKQAGDATGEFDPLLWTAALNLAVNGSGTAEEVGLGPSPVTDDVRLRHFQYTLASAADTMPTSNIGGQLLDGTNGDTQKANNIAAVYPGLVPDVVAPPSAKDTGAAVTAPASGVENTSPPTVNSASAPDKSGWNRKLSGVAPLSPTDGQSLAKQKADFIGGLGDLYSVTQDTAGNKTADLMPQAISTLRESGKRLTQDPALGEKLLQESFARLLASDGAQHQLTGPLTLDDLDKAMEKSGMLPKRVWQVIRDTADVLRTGDPTKPEIAAKIGAGVEATLTNGKFGNIGAGLLLGLLSMQGHPDQAIGKIITASQQLNEDGSQYLWQENTDGKASVLEGEAAPGVIRAVGPIAERAATAARQRLEKFSEGGGPLGKEPIQEARNQAAKAEEEAGRPRPLEGEKRKVFARAEVNGEEFTDVNQGAREDSNPNRPTLISNEVAANSKKARKALPNGKMSEAHAEIATIQRAYEAGKTRNQHMTMHVVGEEVCSHCLSDIASMADKAGLRSLTIYEDFTGGTYRWNRDTKKLEFSK